MRALTGADIVRIWEVGSQQHPLDRALTILATGLPGISRDDLAALSIGQRDGLLLALREQTFGPRMAAQARCPACDKLAEFSLETAAIRLPPGAEPAAQEQVTTDDGYELLFRLPNSWDLAAIVGCADVDEARQVLAQRCVIDARHGGAEVPVAALPEPLLGTLAAQMAGRDRQADIDLELCCPECGHIWSMVFDIAAYLWAEISAQARRLLREVHVLARAYGWREVDILSMSATRRQFYLEMVG